MSNIVLNMKTLWWTLWEPSGHHRDCGYNLSILQSYILQQHLDCPESELIHSFVFVVPLVLEHIQAVIYCVGSPVFLMRVVQGPLLSPTLHWLFLFVLEQLSRNWCNCIGNDLKPALEDVEFLERCWLSRKIWILQCFCVLSDGNMLVQFFYR